MAELFYDPSEKFYIDAEEKIYTMDNMDNTEEFCKIVESRRSVRVYDGTPVPEEVINKCLDLALLSPSSSNLQPWEFYWVRDEDKKEQLNLACLNQTASRTAPELIVAVARMNAWKKNRETMLALQKRNGISEDSIAHRHYKYVVPQSYNLGPLSLRGFVKKWTSLVKGFYSPTRREPTSRAELNTWAVKSVALACQTFMLSMRAYGFDTCPMEGFDSYRVKKLLTLPKDATIVMVISAGKRAPEGIYGSRVRFLRQEFIKEV